MIDDDHALSSIYKIASAGQDVIEGLYRLYCGERRRGREEVKHIAQGELNEYQGIAMQFGMCRFHRADTTQCPKHAV